MNDVRSKTGNNRRKILNLTKKTSLEQIKSENISSLKYIVIDEEEEGLIEERKLPLLDEEEEKWLDFICGQ